MFCRFAYDVDMERLIIDSTIIRAHPIGWERRIKRGKSKGGFTYKVYISVDALGILLRFILTGGENQGITQAAELIEGLESEYMIDDREYGYDKLAHHYLGFIHVARAHMVVVICQHTLAISGERFHFDWLEHFAPFFWLFRPCPFVFVSSSVDSLHWVALYLPVARATFMLPMASYAYFPNAKIRTAYIKH